jgi:hypothetical protein
MRARKVAAVAAATLGLVLGSATAANAATTYVSPGGSGLTCLPASPCSLLTALTTGAGNDIVVAPGDYELSTLTGAITPTSITGAAGQPRPRITLGTGVALPPVTGVIRHVEIASVNTALSMGTATLDDAIVTSGAATAVSVGGGAASGVIRNTVVRALAPDATGVDVQVTPFGGAPARLRNATVVATGAGSTAVRAVGFAILAPGCIIPLSAAADLLNVIARGAANDLVTQDGLCGAVGTITATTSNFDPAHSIISASSVVAARGNQSAPPLFVDQAAGDLREAAGSPTIDAGSIPDVPSDLGTVDLAGVARILGSLPDIGAFEFVPPVLPGGDNPGGGTPGGGSPGPTDVAPIVKLLKPKGLRLRTLPTRGWVLRVSCSEACTLAGALTPAGGKQRVLARGSARRTSGGTTRLRLKATKTGRRALKGKRSMRLRFAVAGRDATGHTGRAQRVLKIRR